MKLIAWPSEKLLTRPVRPSVRPIGDREPGVGPSRRLSNQTPTSMPTMIRSQGDSNLCASISVSNVLSYALRRYLLEENVIPGWIHTFFRIFFRNKIRIRHRTKPQNGLGK